MSRRIQLVIGAALALLLLWLFFRDADLGGVWNELRRADYRWVVAATLLTLLVMVQRAWRWHYLLEPIKSIRLAPLTACTYMGWAFTTLLPGRLGEVARPVLLGRRESISMTAAFATVVLERLFDLLGVLLILVLYLLLFPLPAAIEAEGQEVIAAMRASGFIALAALAVAVALLVAALRWPERVDRLLVTVAGWLPQRLGRHVLPLGRSFLTGFAGIREPRLIGAIGLHTALIWGNVIVSYYLLFFAFDIELPMYAVMPLIAVVVVGIMVPTPAAVGGFHAAAQIGLATLWGVPNEQAISYAIVCHAMVFVPITLIGIGLLAREGLSIGSFAGLQEDGASAAGD